MNRKQALELYKDSRKNPAGLYKLADDLRKRYFANKVELCSVINAKSGNCPEDCAFCAQSAHNEAKVNGYPLLSVDEIVRRAEAASKLKAFGVTIATSGDAVDEQNEFPQICEAVKRIRRQGLINPDASLGRITLDSAKRLKDAGLFRYHHNLETSRRHFSFICTTHTFDDRLRTIDIVKKTGLWLCCGGIFGMGETPEDRIDLAFTLKGLDVDSVPLNFLMPVKGTQLEDAKPLTQDEALMTIAIFRVILPDKQIKVCGGRELNLKARQYDIFACGATGMMVGGYLTQGGNPPEEDLKMLEKLGLEPA